MASFIYLYSKFTEEFLLLSSAGIFTLLALYCYHWVVKTRRLGAARNQVPAGMVKIYLNQLINEAQFVRTQLFGLMNGEITATDAAAKFQMPVMGAGVATAPASTSTSQAPVGEAISAGAAGIPSDLLERLKALESQLSDKESMVININVEKTKLLEEIENLKQNQNAAQGAAASATPADNSALLNKMKALEERLEEYALFEDDLANLKRLQQENTALKKRLGEPEGPTVVSGGNSEAANAEKIKVAGGKAEPEIEAKAKKEAPALEKVNEDPMELDQAAIDALLEGASPVAPEATANAKAKPEAQAAAESAVAASEAATEAEKEASAKQPATAKAKAGDDFEKLIDSVEDSLSKKEERAAATPNAAAPAEKKASHLAAVEAAPEAKTETAKAADPSGSKTDEELLKEFESLLNS